MIAILDCDCERTGGVRKALGGLGVDTVPAKTVDGIERASKLVIPDCRSFKQTAVWIRDRGLVGPLLRAIDRGCPILGISRGMHLLFDVSYEDGQHAGLGVIHGKVTHFDFGTHPAARHFTVPHQGWNQVQWTSDCPLLAGLKPGAYFYFDHTHHPEPLDVRMVPASCNHGIDFCAVAWKGRVFGTQFLPEKSEEAGRTLFGNFVRL